MACWGIFIFFDIADNSLEYTANESHEILQTGLEKLQMDGTNPKLN